MSWWSVYGIAVGWKSNLKKNCASIWNNRKAILPLADALRRKHGAKPGLLLVDRNR